MIANTPAAEGKLGFQIGFEKFRRKRFIECDVIVVIDKASRDHEAAARQTVIGNHHSWAEGKPARNAVRFGHKLRVYDEIGPAQVNSVSNPHAKPGKQSVFDHCATNRAIAAQRFFQVQLRLENHRTQHWKRFIHGANLDDISPRIAYGVCHAAHGRAHGNFSEALHECALGIACGFIKAS